MREDAYHITAHVLARTAFPGIAGILKHETRDFVVEEVDAEGAVCEYRAHVDDGVYADAALEQQAQAQQQAQQQGLLGGLFGLGASALTGGFF